MALKLGDLVPSIDGFLKAWASVRLCPDKIALSDGKSAFNTLTLAVSLAIFMLARSSIAGADTGLAIDLVATLVSAFIVFVAGYIELIFDSSAAGLECARKWATLFSLLWLTSLVLVVVVDAIPLWNHLHPFTTSLIDTIVIPGTLSGSTKNFLRSLIIGVLALLILVVKTKRMDPEFRVFERCALATFVFGFGMNAVLMMLFLYGDVL